MSTGTSRNSLEAVKNKAILAYVPVLHRGYLDFFQRHQDTTILYVLSLKLIKELDPNWRDIRALNPKDVVSAIQAWHLFPRVDIADQTNLGKIRQKQTNIVMPDEDVSHELAKRYLTGYQIKYDSAFLRWDVTRVMRQEPVNFDREVPFRGVVAEIMAHALAASDQSSDWWRRVGAVAARDGQVLLVAHNRHVPSPHSPYADGDPRSHFAGGVNIELSTAEHAEAALIAEAAKRGIALEGADLFVTTFPCPVCAKQIAHSGVKRVYFLTGYSNLDGEKILRFAAIEIIKVKEKDPES